MRKRIIASLVSLSLASGSEIRAQEALWFTPQAAAVDTRPAASTEEASFAQRYGGLLSDPTRRPATTPESGPATTAVPAGGVRQFQIPWSITANAPFPSAQALPQPSATATKAGTASTQPSATVPTQRGAQVSALRPEGRLLPKARLTPQVSRQLTPSKVAEEPASSSTLTANLGVVDSIPWQTHSRVPQTTTPPKASVATSPALPAAPAVVQAPAAAATPQTTANSQIEATPVSPSQAPEKKTATTKLPETRVQDTKIAVAKTPNAKVADAKVADAKVADAKVADTKVDSAKVTAAKAAAASPQPKQSLAQQPTVKPSKIKRAELLVKRDTPTTVDNAPQALATPVTPTPTEKFVSANSTLADSLILPVPAEKLAGLLSSSTQTNVKASSLASSAAEPVTQSVAQPIVQPVAPAVAPAVATPVASTTTASRAAPERGGLVERPHALPAQLPSANSAPQFHLVDVQQSASDRGPVLVAPAPAPIPAPAVVPAPPVIDRLSDRDEVATAPSPSVVQSPVRSVVPRESETGLLNTESMIGPLQNSERLFSRLQIQQDLRDVADRIESGPRGDIANYAWMPAAYTWISPAFYHKPLYFEQPNLERYGLGTKPALQPLASSVHFFGSIPLVPYKSLTHHPRERVYTLGNMRPGNCVPVQRGVILGQSTVGEVMMYWEECSGY